MHFKTILLGLNFGPQWMRNPPQQETLPQRTFPMAQFRYGREVRSILSLLPIWEIVWVQFKTLFLYFLFLHSNILNRHFFEKRGTYLIYGDVFRKCWLYLTR